MQVPQQNGWYDVQFPDGTSEYTLKALTAEKAGKDALIKRLYVDEVRHVARIEVVDKGLTTAQVQAQVERHLGIGQTRKLNAINQPIE